MTDENMEVLTWGKRKVYRCRLCAFDSLDKAKFEDHFAKKHAPLRVIEGGKEDTKQADKKSDKEEN